MGRRRRGRPRARRRRRPSPRAPAAAPRGPRRSVGGEVRGGRRRSHRRWAPPGAGGPTTTPWPRSRPRRRRPGAARRTTPATTGRRRRLGAVRRVGIISWRVRAQKSVDVASGHLLLGPLGLALVLGPLIVITSKKRSMSPGRHGRLLVGRRRRKRRVRRAIVVQGLRRAIFDVDLVLLQAIFAQSASPEVAGGRRPPPRRSASRTGSLGVDGVEALAFPRLFPWRLLLLQNTGVVVPTMTMPPIQVRAIIVGEPADWTSSSKPFWPPPLFEGAWANRVGVVGSSCVTGRGRRLRCGRRRLWRRRRRR